jgi:hypothetical protein
MDALSTTDDPNNREPVPPTAGRNALNRAALNRASLGRAGAQAAGAGAGRRFQVAIAVFAAIGVGVAYGYGVAPAASKPQAAAAAKSTAVRTATLVCPEVIGSHDATVNAITPADAAGGVTPAAGDKATLTPLGGKAPLATLKQSGALSINTGLGGNIANIQQESVPITGQADGGYAPGFTITETISSGTTANTHGVASTPCTAPDTDFWFLGADPGNKSSALVNLFNSDQLAAQVNLTAYSVTGPAGSAATQLGQGLLVPPGGQHDTIDLAGFNDTGDPTALHVVATAGRVSAALMDSDGLLGRDFILAQKPAAHLMLPGVPAPGSKPASAMKLQLLLFSPNTDADVSLHWIGASKIAPTVTAPHLTAGKVQQVDISGVPAPGEAGALQVDSTGDVPILAAIKVTAEGGSDTAYLSPVPALAGESVVADDTSGSIIELTNNSMQSAQVKVTVETATGAPAPQTVTVPAQSTKPVTLQAPKGATSFAVTVTPLDGASAIYAARVMGGGGTLTIQPMASALETVQIPAVRADLSGSVPQP